MSIILFFFLSLILLSPFVCLSTSSWLIYWVGMELGLLSMFPILYNFSSLLVSESSIKYFLVQSMASVLMFFGGSFYFMLFVDSFIGSFLLLVGLLIKLGIFPFHFWVIPVVNGIWYYQIMLLLIPIKIPAFGLINCIMYSSDQMVLLTLSFLSMIMGSMLGNNCSGPRMLMGASSISHSGWIIMSSLVGCMWLYFIVYSFILMMTLFFIWYNDNFMSSLMVLSMSGLPPFLLFLIKFFVLFLMSSNGYNLFFLLIPVLSAVISLNFYLKLSYSFYFNNKNFVSIYYFLWIMIFNVFGGLMMFVLL